MAPLTPSSSTMPEGPLSPESAANISQRQYPSYEEDETMTDFACAMFSPRNWKGGHEQNDIVTDEEKMNTEDDTNPRSLCSCNNDVEGVEPIQCTKKIAANGNKDDPPSEKSLITPDSEDSEDNTVDDNNKPNDEEKTPEEAPKTKKGVTWVDKNPTPLSPMSYASSSIMSPQNGNKR